MIAKSASRVKDHTDPAMNERIRRRTEQNLTYFQDHPAQIDQRLDELDNEWDVERVLETGSSTLTLCGLLLGMTRSRKWFLLSLTVQGFFMQHALEGWCPPLPVFRRLGFRTQDEIDQERYVLKAIRGDFANVASRNGSEAGQTLSAEELLSAIAR